MEARRLLLDGDRSTEANYLPAKAPIAGDILTPHAARLQRRAKAVYHTDWDRTLNTPECVTDFLMLPPHAAQWIAAEGTPSAEWNEIHWTLLARDVEILIVDGVINLGKLPGQFTPVASPLNIKGPNGSSIRAVAIVGQKEVVPRVKRNRAMC
jgi:kynurenine formamidase